MTGLVWNGLDFDWQLRSLVTDQSPPRYSGLHSALLAPGLETKCDDEFWIGTCYQANTRPTHIFSRSEIDAAAEL